MDALINTLDISSTVTRLKRLSLTLPDRTQQFAGPLSFNRLMDSSVERIENMLHSDEMDELLVASRILESTKSYCRWENEHAQVMQRVAEQRRTHQQCTALLASTFELIHRKSLFAHLRQQQVNGSRRQQLLRYFFAGHGYTRGIIAEHGIFLRSSASLACSSYLGTDLLHDAVFQQPLQDYEQMYGAYFDAYCEVVMAPPEVDGSSIAQSVVYSLKCDLGILRQTIFGFANKLSVQNSQHYPDGLLSADQSSLNS